MKQLINEEELIGKTIKTIAEDDQLFIVFNEDCFAVFHSNEGNVHLESDKVDLTPNRYNINLLVQMGIMSPEYSIKFLAKLKEADAQGIRAFELKQLNELKAKYENE